jgi:hypothetical protein
MLKYYCGYLIRTVLSFIILSLFVSSYSQNKPDSTNYYLKLETGRVIYGNLDYIIPNIGGDYVKVNDTSYYIPDIKSFNCSWGYFAKFQPDSLSNKVEIFKRSKKGKLDFYSGKTTLYSSAGSNMGPMAYDYKDNYYTKDKVHLLTTDYKNLCKSLNDNPVSMDILQQYKDAGYLALGYVATGIISAVYGIYGLDHKQYVSGSIFTVLSAIVFYLSWNQYNAQDTALKNAINAYNQ